MIKTQMFIAAALLVGVAIGYFAGGHGRADDAVSATVAQNVKRPVADKGEEASVRALRRRIAELEKALAEKDGASEVAISNAVAEAVKARPPEPPRRQNWRERMEEMKKNDPERYTQMTNRFASWRRSRAEQARSRIDFLSSIDTSHMGADAKKTHEALQELIARREEIEAKLQDANLSDNDRGELMRQLRESHGELMRLNGEERGILLDEVSRLIGFEGEDAKEISSTIQEVIHATDGGWGGRYHGGPRGQRPRGSGGR